MPENIFTSGCLWNFQQIRQEKLPFPRHLAEYEEKSKIGYGTFEKMCYNTVVWLKECSVVNDHLTEEKRQYA